MNNPKLKPCDRCGNPISSGVTITCPHCGSVTGMDRGMRVLGWLFAGFILFMAALIGYALLEDFIGEVPAAILALTVLALIASGLFQRFKVRRAEGLSRGDAARAMLRKHEMRERAGQDKPIG